MLQSTTQGQYSQRIVGRFSRQLVLSFSSTTTYSRCALIQLRPNYHNTTLLLLRKKPNVHRNNRWLSSSTSFPSDMNTQLRSMIKPFLLKCHPDVHVALSSKKINLAAVQNLNAYLDTIHNISTGTFKQYDSSAKDDTGSSSDRIVEIDFVILVDNDRTKRKKKNQNELLASRRKVELTLPPQQLCTNLVNYSNSSIAATSNNDRVSMIQQLQQRLFQHTRHELVKLLRIAGLSDEVIEESSHDIHALILEDILGPNFGRDRTAGLDPYHDQYSPSSTESSSRDTNNVFRRAHHRRVTPTTTSRERNKTPFEISRDKYTANIPWHNYQKLYDEAVVEMNADYMTRGLIAKHPGRRRAMIARILSNIRVQKSSLTGGDNESVEPQRISFVDQLIAFRRLTILLDTNFDTLQMEEFGQMWENSRIILTEERRYNTSRSALFKRKNAVARASGAAMTSLSFDDTETTGYSFTLHPNLSVTITIPIDFQDDELIDELDSNVWDFYNFIGDGTEEFFQQRSSA